MLEQAFTFTFLLSKTTRICIVKPDVSLFFVVSCSYFVGAYKTLRDCFMPQYEEKHFLTTETLLQWITLRSIIPKTFIKKDTEF